MHSKTYCALAWIGASSITGNGVYRPCCTFSPNTKIPHWSKPLADNINYYNYLRKDLLAGRQPSECKNCWNLEKAEKTSIRQLANTKFQHLYQYIIANTDKDGATSVKPIYFDMKLSNLCNLGCRMCAPDISSVIEAEVRNNPKENWTEHDLHFPAMQGTWENNAFNEILRCKDITDLKFTGGEPFANPKIYEFLTYLPNKEKINLEFITNGLLIKDKHFKLFEKFASIEISVSCDGTEDVYNYIRWPADWKKFTNKFHKIKNNIQKTQVVSVISAYNIHDVKNMIDYFGDVSFSMSPLHTPKYMHPFVQGVTFDLDNNLHRDIKTIKKSFLPYDKRLHEIFIQQTQIRDRLRQQKFSHFVDCVA